MHFLIEAFRIPVDSGELRFVRGCLALSLGLHVLALMATGSPPDMPEPGQVLRATGMMLGWGALMPLSLCVFRWLRSPRHRRWAIAGVTLPWYLPFLSVSLSPENLASTWFALGFALLVLEVQARRADPAVKLPDTVGRALGIGALFGLAARHYPPAAILALGAMAWAFRFGGFPPRVSWSWLAGFAAVFTVGRLFAGAPLWPWLLAQTQSPWYGGPVEAVMDAGPGIGVLLAVGIVSSWVLKPKLSLTWATVPFVAFQLWAGPGGAAAYVPIVLYGPLQGMLAWQERPLPFPALVKKLGLRLLVLVNFAWFAGALYGQWASEAPFRLWSCLSANSGHQR